MRRGITSSSSSSGLTNRQLTTPARMPSALQGPGSRQRRIDGRPDCEYGQVAPFLDYFRLADIDQDLRGPASGTPTPFPLGYRTEAGDPREMRRLQHVAAARFSSLGAITVRFGIDLKYEKSKRPWWVGPSSPTMPPAVQGKHDGQVLEADIMKHLVVGPLQECRVNGDNRFETLPWQAPRQKSPRAARQCPHRKSARELAGKILEPCALAHGRRYGDNLFVLARQLHHGAAENLRVGRRRARVRRRTPRFPGRKGRPRGISKALFPQTRIPCLSS